MSRELAELLRQKADEFELRLKIKDYSPQTCRNYRRTILELITWVEGRDELQNLADLSPQVLEKYWSHICQRPSRGRKRSKKKNLSTGSLRLYAAGLRQFFRDLTRRGDLLSDPSFCIGAPRLKHTVRSAVLTQREVLRLLMVIELHTLEGLRDRAIVELLYATGVRRAELLGLDLQDLDLDSGWLHVLGKGKKVRLVPVGREAELALRAYLRDARPHLTSLHQKALFVDTEGERYSSYQLGTLLHRLAARANIKKRVTPHVLRHSCATHMLAGKADIRYIQALLGHSNINTTQVYTQVELSELQQVMRACHPRERDL